MEHSQGMEKSAQPDKEKILVVRNGNNTKESMKTMLSPEKKKNRKIEQAGEEDLIS